MFVSTGYLSIQYGVNSEIAKFFVDREPPADNLYWKDKLLYLRFETGYIFIPLIVDILFKLGIDKTELLSERFVGLMEDIGHISALEETKQLSREQAIKQCSDRAAQMAVNIELHQLVNAYFLGETNHPFHDVETGIKALHRGDVFLFSLCALNIPSHLYTTIAQYWFALISLLLLMDDAQDVDADVLEQDENAFIEVGLTTKGIEHLKALVQQNLRLIEKVNKSLTHTVDKQIVDLFHLHFQHLKN
jgi:hypothetical protein